MVSRVNDVVDAVTLGNQVHLARREVIISEGSKSRSAANDFLREESLSPASSDSVLRVKGSFYPTYAPIWDAGTSSTHHRVAQMLAHTLRQV